MKARILLFSLGLFFSIHTFSQDLITLSGEVKDKSDQLIQGATVVIKNTYNGVATDKQGEFRLSVKPNQTYVLEVKFLGYKTVSTTVEAKNLDIELVVVMEESPYLTDEVIVSATRNNRKTPMTSQLLTKEELNKNDITADIPFQLGLTPSVIVSSETGTGMGYTGLRIRGTDPSRINMTINGVPLNDAESHGVYWVNMPDFISSVNDIQIQRGVGSSTNGAAAFGASINFQTSRSTEKPYAQLSSSVGSFNTFKNNISLGTGTLENGFNVDARLSKLTSDGYIDRGFSDHQSAFMSVGYHTKKSVIKANVIIGNQRTGITWWGVPVDSLPTNRTFNPAGEYTDINGDIQHYKGETDNYKQNHYHLFYGYEVTKHFTISATLFRTTGKGYYEEYKADKAFSDYGVPTFYMLDSVEVSSSDIIHQKWLDNDFYGGILSANFKNNKWDVSYGLNFNTYNGDHFGYVLWAAQNKVIPHQYQWYSNVGVKKETSAFIKGTYAILSHLTVFGDIQQRTINYTMVGPDSDLSLINQAHSYGFLNPKAGIFYTPKKGIDIYASVAVAHREPARADLENATKGGGTQFPSPEQLIDYELGVKWTTQKASFQANGFYMDYHNQLVNTGKLNDVGYPMMTNVLSSYRLGIELVAGTKITDELTWEGNLTISENMIEDYQEYAYVYDNVGNEEYIPLNYGSTTIAYSPNIIGASVFTYTKKGLTALLASKYVGEQYIDNTKSYQRKLDAYLVNDVRLGYSFTCKNKMTVNTQLSVNNLFDTDYITHGYGGQWFEQDDKGIYQEKTWAYYFPQAFRHYMLTVQLGF